MLPDSWKYNRFTEFCLSPFYKIRTFIRNCKRIIDYWPVIWENYDWDQNYFLYLVRFKITRMEKLFKGDKCDKFTVPRAVRALTEIRILLTRLENDEYDVDAYSKWKKEFPECGGKHATEESSLRFRELNEFAEYRRRQDIERIGLLLRKYLGHWWN